MPPTTNVQLQPDSLVMLQQVIPVLHRTVDSGVTRERRDTIAPQNQRRDTMEDLYASMKVELFEPATGVVAAAYQ